MIAYGIAAFGWITALICAMGWRDTHRLLKRAWQREDHYMKMVVDIVKEQSNAVREHTS